MDGHQHAAFFSALAIWPSIGRWTGGGLFAAERDLVLLESEDGLTPIENVAMPTSWRIRSAAGAGACRPSAYAPSPSESEQHARIAEALSASGLKWVDWIDLRGATTCCSRRGDGALRSRLRQWRSRLRERASGRRRSASSTCAS